MKFRYNQTATPPRRRWLKLISLAAVAIILAAAIGWFMVNRWYTQSLQPLGEEPTDIIVVIEPGSSARNIGDELEDEGVIRSSTAFSWYVDRNGFRDELQAGTYRLSPTLSVEEVVDIIANGRVDTSLVTIFPGRRLDQVEADLIESGFEPAAVSAALNTTYDHPLLASKPADASLEGYLFPETYQVTAETTPDQVIVKAFDVFYGRIDNSIFMGLEEQGLSLHEAIILASIVQGESSDPEVQAMVAQVFLKRLREDIALGADPTFRYAAAISGQEASVSIDSPYNTRIYKGLPPGPISSFNISALRAVAQPADTDYLYFVAGDDGITRFSNTLEEHEALRDEFCIELCQL